MIASKSQSTYLGPIPNQRPLSTMMRAKNEGLASTESNDFNEALGLIPEAFLFGGDVAHRARRFKAHKSPIKFPAGRAAGAALASVSKHATSVSAKATDITLQVEPKVFVIADFERLAGAEFKNMLSALKTKGFEGFTDANFDALKKIDEKIVRHQSKEVKVKDLDPEIRKGIYKVFFKGVANLIDRLGDSDQIALMRDLAWTSIAYKGSGIKDQKFKESLKSLAEGTFKGLENNFRDEAMVVQSSNLGARDLMTADKSTIYSLIETHIERATDISLDAYLKFEKLVNKLDLGSQKLAYAYFTRQSLKTLVEALFASFGVRGKETVKQFLGVFLNGSENLGNK